MSLHQVDVSADESVMEISLDHLLASSQYESTSNQYHPNPKRSSLEYHLRSANSNDDMSSQVYSRQSYRSPPRSSVLSDSNQMNYDPPSRPIFYSTRSDSHISPFISATTNDLDNETIGDRSFYADHERKMRIGERKDMYSVEREGRDTAESTKQHRYDEGQDSVREYEIDEAGEIAAGDYKRGVGFDSLASRSSAETRRVAGRVRRMEREFLRTNDDGQLESNAAEKVIAAGTKKRLALRIFEGVGAVGVGIASIGASVFTKPLTPPPPSAKLPLYLLYVLPFLSLSLTLYLFVFRPCSTRSRLSKSMAHQSNKAMVIPLLQGGDEYEEGVGCCCFGRTGSSAQSNGNNNKQHASINLIVNPSMFSGQSGSLTEYDNRASKKRRQRRKQRERTNRRRSTQEESDSDSSSASSASSDAWSINAPDSRSARAGDRRRGILSTVHRQAEWKLARATLKLVLATDLLLCLLWLGASAWAIIFGQTCKPGTFEGFCNYYNSAEALAFVLGVAFGASFFLDCLDLKYSRLPPR